MQKRESYSPNRAKASKAKSKLCDAEPASKASPAMHTGKAASERRTVQQTVQVKGSAEAMSRWGRMPSESH